MFSRQNLEDKYQILRQALSSCSSMGEIQKFLSNLLTLNELKDHLLTILDNKFRLKQHDKMDSIYLNCCSFHDILCDDVHIKIISYLSPSQYSSIPCISKHFEFIMSSYPMIYNLYKYQVIISKTLTSTILNGEFSNGIYLSHSLNSLKIQPSFNNSFNFDDVKDIGLGNPNKPNIINPFNLSFPWKYIKIWHINNCDLRRRNESKIFPPESIINVLKKKMNDGTVIKFNDNTLINQLNGNGKSHKTVHFDNLDAVELKIAIASRTVPTCKLLKKASKNIESFNIDCIDNGDDLKLYPSFKKCKHLFIEGSMSQNPFYLFYNINTSKCKFINLQCLELENLTINPISSYLSAEIEEIYKEIVIDVFQDIELNSILYSKDFASKNDFYCKLLYDRACMISLHRDINYILLQCEKCNVPLLVFRYNNNLSMMQKAMRNVVVMERKLYGIINKTPSQNFNNKWGDVASNAFNRYDTMIMPSSLEFLSLTNIFCNVDITKCNKMIAINLNCITYKQIKFPLIDSNINNHHIIPYLKVIMKNATKYMLEWVDVTNSIQPIPVRFVYLENENGCISTKEYKTASFHIGSSYDLDEYIERITTHNIDEKCIYLTTLIPNMFEKCIDINFPQHIRQYKLNQYHQKSIDVIRTFLH